MILNQIQVARQTRLTLSARHNCSIHTVLDPMPQNKKPTKIETRAEDTDVELADYFGSISDGSEDADKNRSSLFHL